MDTPEFRKGYFEVQDEASQLVGLRVLAQPGEKVLDYCAGSAGKTLTFAHQLRGTGKIYLHDVRASVLVNAKKRLKRAGVNNVVFCYEDNTLLKDMKGQFDWIVLDVPCTGTGTLRRNPDIKMKFTRARLDHFVQLQQGIIAESLPYLKKETGRIVYSTCSLLPQVINASRVGRAERLGAIRVRLPSSGSGSRTWAKSISIMNWTT